MICSIRLKYFTAFLHFACQFFAFCVSSNNDAEKIKECFRTLFINDCSSARPDGSMEVQKIYWWKHNCKDGQYSSKKIHDSLKITVKEGVKCPESFDDYDIKLENFDDLIPEEINGI